MCVVLLFNPPLEFLPIGVIAVGKTVIAFLNIYFCGYPKVDKTCFRLRLQHA